MSQPFDIVVVGAGPVGAVTATLLVKRRIAPPERIACIADELPTPQRPDDDIDLRVFALNRATERILNLCGIWTLLPEKRVNPFERMCVWDAAGTAGGRASIQFDCAELGEPNLGTIVDGRALAAAALDGMRRCGVALLQGRVAALESVSMPQLRLSDGRKLNAQLVIGADGAASALRNLAGIETAGHSYTQEALVAHVRTGEPHRNTAWQRFLETGPLAFLPLADGRSSIVWSAAAERAVALKHLGPEAFGRALTEAAAGALGECTLASEIGSFPLQLRYALQYVRPGIALVGDAAHTVHPLAGQGLNLGIMDAAVLADVLASRSSEIGELPALRRYERWRKAENMLSATAFDALDRLFSNGDPTLGSLRGAGLALIDRLPFAKRSLARRALGLAGDLPSYLVQRVQ
jgi:2-polyprenylphenol 6-hydroxylase